MIALLAWTLATRAADSPHAQTGKCDRCHAPAAEGAIPDAMTWTAGGADAACLACHEPDPHTVGLVPEAGQVPAGFPLVGGKLACLSCHDEPACDTAPAVAD